MKLTKMAVACSLAMTLVACGGGGSSSSSPNNGGTTVAATRTLEGVAAKGLIKNGVVKVYVYGADGVKSATPLVESRTSSVDGSYSVSLGSNVGLFTVEVSADAATTMADEFLGDIAMPAGMTLRSLVQLDSAASTTIKGYVTPFSEMLVSAAAKATGGLTTANVSLAQAGVVKLLGFDPLTTKPFNANSDAASNSTDASEKLQSVLLAAISKIANDTSNDLGCSGSVSEKIKCVVDATTGTVVLTGGNLSISLKAQVAVRAASESVAANTTINRTKLISLDGVNGFSQASVTTGSADDNPVAAAKSFFASIRSNFLALLNAEKTGSLNLQVTTLQADFEAATAPVDKDLANWVLLMDSGIAHFKYAKENPTLVFSTNGYDAGVGKCFLYSDADTTNPVTTGAQAINVGCRLNRKGIVGDATKAYTKGITLTPVGSSLTSYTYKARARVDNVSVNPPVVLATIGDIVTGTVSYTESAGVLTSIVIAGDMPARNTSTGVKITDHETWNVNATRALEADNVTTKVAFTGDITAYKAGTGVGALTLKAGSFVRAVMDGQTVSAQGLKEVNLVLAATGISSSVTGTLVMKDFSLDGSGLAYSPTDVKFSGNFTNASAEFFNGTLTAKATNYATYQSSVADSSSNFLKGSASFVGIVKIASRPDVSVSLASSVSAYNADSLTGQFDDGTNLILISSTKAQPGVLRLSSAKGLSMVLSDGVNVTDVFKNSSKIATYTRNSGVINYNDGSLETVK
ncbi:hypothetical protein QN362_07605 [Actimicrobium sp. CCC2.4]|uniref:hypothetical protein n=1 Tax=Actimicrobium sp. CCC2.4 TaxID=3048606 RepID=UPI002AC987ED|nr:hypothetical protein [Actimicrobium sp. CCC2.4]MEB0135194.1 hypothetical protein [Actimicrobium sp. CCC2.4]WPX30991.1 hypothetical protein RHM62_12065 [Actimicrobium sp. CCC2.4]